MGLPFPSVPDSTHARRMGVAISILVLLAFASPVGAQGDPTSGIPPIPGTSEVDPTIEPSDVRIWESSPVGAITYRPARGLRFGDTGLQVGGFGTVELEREEGEAFAVSLDSLNFLVLYQPIERFRIFSEIELGGFLDYQAKGDVESDVTINTERLFGELSLSDRFNLRFGKFQTPIGRWNLVPAEPFVWTATTPVLIDAAFDEHQTGVALQGTFFPNAGAVDYWIYGQVLDPLDPSDSPPPSDRSVGGRIQFTRPRREWSVGGSFLASMRNGEWSSLAGLDAEISLGRFELASEAAYQSGEIPDRDLAGVFLEGRWEIVRGFRAIARYEHFDRLGSKHDAANLADLGFGWQPVDWLILKATYRISDQTTDDVDRGFAASISVVF